MAVELPHSKLITSAARDVLRPLGLRRRGRSRVWLDDRGWWLGVVEFQPSGFSRGSYLNVGVCWLWGWNGDVSFDVGSRVKGAGFVSYETDEQFAPEARRFAELAAARVEEFRAAFPDLTAAADYLFAHNNGIANACLHAATVAALIGRYDHAIRLLHDIEADAAARPAAYGDSDAWMRHVHESAVCLRTKTGQARFLAERCEQVRAGRAALKLPPLADSPW